jgi:uncharacterized protein
MPEKELALTESDEPILFKDLRIIGPIGCVFAIQKEKGGYTVKGTVKGTQEFMCSKTLEPFERPFEVKIDVLVFQEQGLTQQQEDDGSEDFFKIKIPANQNEVDLTETVRQLVILQEPMIPVKDEL